MCVCVCVCVCESVCVCFEQRGFRVCLNLTLWADTLFGESLRVGACLFECLGGGAVSVCVSRQMLRPAVWCAMRRVCVCVLLVVS